MVVVVQLVRASDCGSECRGFESHQPPKIAGTMRIVPAILFPLRKLACRQREKNSRSNAEGVSCFFEQELHNGMDKRSAVNPIPELKNCASLLAGRGKRMAGQTLKAFSAFLSRNSSKGWTSVALSIPSLNPRTAQACLQRHHYVKKTLTSAL